MQIHEQQPPLKSIDTMDRMVRVFRRSFKYSMVIILFSFSMLIAFNTGPDPGKTGAPFDRPNEACTQCHNKFGRHHPLHILQHK